MEVKGKVVMVTGANRGIGEALVREFLQRGVRKVYAAARDASAVAHLVQLDTQRVVAKQLDIVNHSRVAEVAGKCTDVQILVNNAGINRCLWFMAPTGHDAAREEMEVNFFGTLAVCRAFTPVLSSNGGGTIANVCSILGLINIPVNGTYCASKAAGHSLLQGLRGELRPKKIKVIGIYPGPVDTRLTAGLNTPKASPEAVAAAIVNGIDNDVEDVFPDPMSQHVYAMLLKDPKGIEKEFAAMIPA